MFEMTADEALRVLEAQLTDERRAQIDGIVTGQNPMEKWERHTGVSTFAHLQNWAESQLREVLTMRAYRDFKNGGAPSDDDLGNYLVGKSGALSMMLANMRQIAELPPAPSSPGFDAGYAAALKLAIDTCNERAGKHAKRGTRLASDYQSEASACAFSIQKKADQRTEER